MKLKNFRNINDELFEADSTDEGDVYIFPDNDVAVLRSNEYRRQGYKSCVRKMSQGYVVYYRRGKPKQPRIALSRRFNGKDYYPERNKYNDIVIRSKGNALDKVSEYKSLGYSCKIVDFMCEENLVIIYLRQPGDMLDNAYNIVVVEE